MLEAEHVMNSLTVLLMVVTEGMHGLTWYDLGVEDSDAISVCLQQLSAQQASKNSWL